MVQVFESGRLSPVAQRKRQHNRIKKLIQNTVDKKYSKREQNEPHYFSMTKSQKGLFFNNTFL